MTKPPAQADVLDPPEEYYARAANGNYIPSRATIQKTEPVIHTAPLKKERHWTIPLGITMCSCLVALMFWQFTIVPDWTRFQEQLACGSTHICMATVEVTPGKTRTFVSLIYNARIMVYELPDAENTDGHSYPGAIIYTGTDWHTITPRLVVVDVNHDGHLDLVITSPDFGGADPVLYNQGDGTFSWQQKG